MTGLSPSRLGAVDRVATQLSTSAFATAVLPFVYAAALGSGIFTLRHLSWLELLDTNKVPTRASYEMAAWTAIAWVLLGLLYGGVLLLRRRQFGESGGVDAIRQINTLLTPVLALPLVTRLMFAGIERDNPKETFFLVALAAAAVGYGVHAALRWIPSVATAAPPKQTEGEKPPRPFHHLGPMIAIGAGAAAYAWFFSKLAITNHHALNTSIRDLAFYDNIFYQTLHGRLLGCSFFKDGFHVAAHFDPILILFAPLYLIHPHAELLLVVQSVWLASGVLPLYLLAHDKLHDRLLAVVLAAMYLLHPALHGMNLYEFHSLTLVTPLLLWLLVFLERRCFGRYWWVLALVFLCRDDLPLVTFFVGLYALRVHALGMPGGRDAPPPQLLRVGWTTILWSAVYFVVAKVVCQTSWSGKVAETRPYSYAYYYEDLIPNKNNVLGILVTFLTNPVFALRTLLGEPKVLFALTIFLPLALLPFFARRARILIAYGVLFCMLASRPAVYSVHFQYPAILLPFAFALTPIALLQLERSEAVARLGCAGRHLTRSLIAGALMATLLISWKYGAILENTTFQGGFRAITRELSDEQREAYRFVRDQADRIPGSASVAASGSIGPHVSNRRTALHFPDQFDEATHPKVDYLFVNEGELSKDHLRQLKRTVEEGHFLEQARRKKLVVYKSSSS